MGRSLTFISPPPINVNHQKPLLSQQHFPGSCYPVLVLMLRQLSWEALLKSVFAQESAHRELIVGLGSEASLYLKISKVLRYQISSE